MFGDYLQVWLVFRKKRNREKIKLDISNFSLSTPTQIKIR